MSAPPSPHSSHLVHNSSNAKRRDRPPALELTEPKAASDGELRYEPATGHGVDTHSSRLQQASAQQQRSHVASLKEPQSEYESDAPRPISATSSLDPYYFGAHSDSPVPAVPPLHLRQYNKTPDRQPSVEPVTPARNPAAIDRRALIGVGDLTTPRWARKECKDYEDPAEEEEHIPIYEQDIIIDEALENDGPDSPWTIEAIDGEQDERDEPTEVPVISRAIRTRRSMAEESGGEEILYPRNPHLNDSPRKLSVSAEESDTRTEDSPSAIGIALTSTPPVSFPAPVNRAKKRNSDEFEKDQAGVVSSRHSRSSTSGSIKTKTKEEKPSVRRHRSLGVGLPTSGSIDAGKPKDKKRDSVTLTSGASVKSSTSSSAPKPAKHTRHTSASSSSSSHGETHRARRVHTTDFSHLPPSPSSSSIQQFLKHSSSREIYAHTSPNVAHSLLRGTQEGWSGLDDEATAEALRKLDGLTGKSVARTRSSVSISRGSSFSRPGTPGKGNNAHWEGISSKRSSASVRDSVGLSKDKERHRDSGSDTQRHSTKPAPAVGVVASTEPSGEASGNGLGSGEEQSLVPSSQDKLSKRSSMRSSFVAKRASASSTTYTGTPTTSSRDSGSMSAATSLTSVSANSGRISSSKLRRNSAGSDLSVHSGEINFRDRAASLVANGEPEDEAVPPVPPLPKDLSGYKSPPQTASTFAFPSPSEEKGHAQTLEVPHPAGFRVSPEAQNLLNQEYTSSDSAAAATKSPSKKWSFTRALSIKRSSSPSSPSAHVHRAPSFSVSPRSATFGHQLRKTTSKDQPLSPSVASKVSADAWSPIQPEAMGSATSLASLSSVGSAHAAKSPHSSSITASRTPEHLVPSRPTTPSSGGATHTGQNVEISPGSSIRRNSSKRLTPSSIPSFRRSSSQSVAAPLPPPAMPSGSPSSDLDPSLPSGAKAGSTSSKEGVATAPTTPHKKSSMLSLGLPSLLKGSTSKRSLQDKSDPKSGKEGHGGKSSDREKSDKEKHKKDDKDRSESRISSLMGRKRGKTLSSAEPKRPKPVALPPMQVTPLPASTSQRVANLKANSAASSTSSGLDRLTTTSSRVTAHTSSSMQKQSDSSLRGRNQLPTIAGSPSVSTVSANSSHSTKENRDMPSSSLVNSVSSLSKETPTKIPRISSRASAAGSPSTKSSVSTVKKTSTNANSTGTSSANPSPVPDNAPLDEFGVLDETGKEELKPRVGAAAHRNSVRGSPSTASRVPRQVAAPASSSTSTATPRKANRDSISFSGLRKSSTASTASVSSGAPNESHHRFSALSPSKHLKLLSPKVSLAARATHGSAAHNANHVTSSPSSSRQSLSTPSPAPSSVDEDEVAGDEEMLSYIKRQHAKKLANGASQQELDNLLSFPDPIRPATPISPTALLKSPQAQFLSEYERKEVLDYPSVYCIGTRGDKKPATPSNPTNNYGYDDDRGDYLVVNRDHLAYRYEVVDTLGKGSFGQVLQCRDHCTGESVAIKIIRNKKRFHHQALVEIKILDNLRKWDPDEKHHVIKMTEHFYFRNHLCIAMELLSINLYELIKANGFVGFTTALIRRFTSQMLLSLNLMRTHRIVHCDLKPENVLLRHPAKSAIKVIDFGSSCFEHEKIYTYIQSRFYRSPEVILGMNYHMAIDMWSLGCILAELYTGFPIFPGENEQEQLSCIMEVLGVPDKDFVNRSSRKNLFFDRTGAPRPVINSKGRRRRPGTKTLQQVLRCDEEPFVDFIAKCLVWDPEKRMKPQAALRHPFVIGGKRPKVVTPAPASRPTITSTPSLTSSSRGKPADTPKKSQIGAPTPLTARVSRNTQVLNPNTPSGSSSISGLGSSSRSYRASQSQTLSSYHTSRTVNGFATSTSK